MVEVVALGGDASEGLQDEAGNRVVVPPGEAQVELIVHLVYLHAPVYVVGVLVDGLVLHLRLPALLANGPDDLLYELLDGDQTSNASVLVHGDRHLVARAAHLAE